MGKKFNLKLQVKMTGVVLAWEVFLEKREPKTKVGAWVYNLETKCYERTFNDYEIKDDTLDIFIGSEGKQGGKTSCKVTINNVDRVPEVVSNNIDPHYNHETYSI